MNKKKSYKNPNLKIYGTLKEITLKNPGPGDSLGASR